MQCYHNVKCELSMRTWRGGCGLCIFRLSASHGRSHKQREFCDFRADDNNHFNRIWERPRVRLHRLETGTRAQRARGAAEQQQMDMRNYFADLALHSSLPPQRVCGKRWSDNSRQRTRCSAKRTRSARNLLLKVM